MPFSISSRTFTSNALKIFEPAGRIYTEQINTSSLNEKRVDANFIHSNPVEFFFPTTSSLSFR